MGKTFKDQRDWERKHNNKPRREFIEEEFDRKNRHYHLNDIVLDDDEMDEYDEYDLEYYD